MPPSNELTIDNESTILTLQAMLKQEETGYTVEDYFQRLPLETSYGLPVDACARRQIGDWCIKIMDACSYSRDTAAVAMSCLDRFLATSDGYQVVIDRSLYQLAALTAVYMSIKIHCPKALSPDLVAMLSQGSYARLDIEAMERRMLLALRWRVNPPTVMDFLRMYLALIPPESLDAHAREVVAELAGYQADLSILEFQFATVKASHVAFASLLNAVQSIYNDELGFCESVAEIVTLTTDIDYGSLSGLRALLYEAITDQTGMEVITTGTSAKSHGLDKRMRRDSFAESPRSVYEQYSSHE